MEITFSVFRSVSAAGKYSVTVTNQKGETLVLGHTHAPDEVMSSLSNQFTGSWNHNETIKYHDLVISVPDAECA